MPARRGNLERALDVLLAFDLTKICGNEQRLKFITAGGLIRLNETATSQMVVKIRQRFNADDL